MFRAVSFLLLISTFGLAAFSQGDSICKGNTRLELGLASELSFQIGTYVDEYSHSGVRRVWKYDMRRTPFSKPLGVYVKYDLARWLSVFEVVQFSNYKTNYVGLDYNLNYQGTVHTCDLMIYRLESIIFNTGFCVKYEIRFLRPTLFFGVENTLLFRERVGVYEQSVGKFFEDNKWRYYSSRINYGLSLDFVIKGRAVLGLSGQICHRSFWQTQKTIVPFYRTMDFQIGITTGLVIK